MQYTRRRIHYVRLLALLLLLLLQDEVTVMAAGHRLMGIMS